MEEKRNVGNKNEIKSEFSKNKINKKDFVDLIYTGYANGEIFDSNIEEDLKNLKSDAKPVKTIIVVGQEMVVKGLDNALEGMELGIEKKVTFGPKEGFGERKRELVKTIPLSLFSEKKVDPKPGMMLTLDNTMVKIIAVSGARVVTDFNNPLSGKDITYKFKVLRKVTDEKEKVEALFKGLFKFIPEFEIKDKVTVKGPKGLDEFVKIFGEKFKDLLGKELLFEEKKEGGLEEKVEEKDVMDKEEVKDK